MLWAIYYFYLCCSLFELSNKNPQLFPGHAQNLDLAKKYIIDCHSGIVANKNNMITQVVRYDILLELPLQREEYFENKPCRNVSLPGNAIYLSFFSFQIIFQQDLTFSQKYTNSLSERWSEFERCDNRKYDRSPSNHFEVIERVRHFSNF